MSDGAPAGPLAGTVVVEIGALGPSPFAGMILADLGADVIRIDRHQPAADGIEAIDPRFDIVNRGKRSLALDLKRPEAIQILLGILERADVLTEGFRPGVAERLGIGPAECLERNPRLVYGRMTGWGQDGPLAQTAGHDINYIALSGALYSIGTEGGPPQIPVNLVGDMGGGALYLVIGILAALSERARSGRGQVVDASILDGTAQLLTYVHSMLAAGTWREERGVNVLDGGAPFYSVYETSDGGYMAVGAGENKFFTNLLKALELPDDPRQQEQRERWADLRLRMAAVFRTRTRAEWTAYFEGRDCCVTPVLRPTESVDHPHVANRRTMQSRNGILQAAATPRFSRSSGAAGSAPPVVGEHSLEILRWLGCTDPEALIASGVVSAAGFGAHGEQFATIDGHGDPGDITGLI